MKVDALRVESLMQRKVWKVYFLTLAVAALLAMFGYEYLWNQYYETLPSSPDRAAGRIYRDDFHGFARYETRTERFLLRGVGELEMVTVFLIFLSLIGRQEWREWRNRRARSSPTARLPRTGG